jgi:hypothetical protein
MAPRLSPTCFFAAPTRKCRRPNARSSARVATGQFVALERAITAARATLDAAADAEREHRDLRLAMNCVFRAHLTTHSGGT